MFRSQNLKIASIGEDVLRKKSSKVPLAMFGSPELSSLFAKMRSVVEKEENVGVAAPQLSASWRIFALSIKEELEFEIEDGKKVTLNKLPTTICINPVLSYPRPTEKIRSWEMCLSVPDTIGLVERKKEVICSYLSEDGKPKKIHCHGMHAIVLQHEFDHLDGILFVDRISDPKLKFLVQDFESNLFSKYTSVEALQGQTHFLE